MHVESNFGQTNSPIWVRNARPYPQQVAAVKPSDYFSVLVLVLFSGSPVLNNETVVKVSLPVLFLYAITKYLSTFLKRHFFYLAAFYFITFGIIFFFQFLEFGELFPWMGSILLKLIAGGLIVYSLGSRFPLALLMVMYHLAAVSLVMFLVQLYLGPQSFPDLIPTFSPGENLRSVFIHTFLVTDASRNSGIFWEPGAYQGFINLAFFLFPGREIWARNLRVPVLVLLLALVTTFSTAGYITCLSVAILKLLLGKGTVRRYIAAALMMCASLLSYYQLDFIGSKIESELNYTMQNEGRFNPSRSGALLFDLGYIEKHPLIGNGFSPQTRYADHPELQDLHLGHGNGFSGFLAGMGFIGLGAYFYGLLRSRFFKNWRDRIVVLFFIGLVLQGQHFLLLPLFLGLPFLIRKRLPGH